MTRPCVIALVASCTLAASILAQVQQSRASLIADSARFRSASWQVVPVVRLDSGKTSDTMAVRRLGDVERLGPGRYVFAGQLTNGKKWALFSLVNGVITRIAVEDREFLVNGVKTKFWVGPSVLAVGGKAVALLAVGQRMPNALWTTDGTTWKPLVQKGDSLRLGAESVIVDGFSGGTPDSTGALLLTVTSKTPKFHGILRFADGGVEKVLSEGDSLPGVPALKIIEFAVFGLTSGLRSLQPTRNGWVALVRNDLGSRRYLDLVLLRDSAGATKLIAQSDTFGIRGQNDSIGGKVFSSPTGDVLMQRGRTIGFATRTGEWKPLVGPELMDHNDGHALTEVAWLDGRSNRALLGVTLTKVHVSNSTSGVTISRTWSTLPLLFHHDGAQTRRVRPDSAFESNMFMNVPPMLQAISRVPGYSDVLVRHGAFSADSASVFDAERSAWVGAPKIRTTDGDLPSWGIVAWENPGEALARTGGGQLSWLRRAP